MKVKYPALESECSHCYHCIPVGVVYDHSGFTFQFECNIPCKHKLTANLLKKKTKEE